MIKPTGTVTFLFTDIEGSTKLSQDFPETLHDALEKHNSILNEAVESNNGFVFKIIGDAFCCAFQNTKDAVKASVDAQKNLNSEKWNEAFIKVRMGIHSGVAEWSGTDYMGYISLARTSRVMSVAYGGQILISNDAYNLISSEYLNEISFRDLGERRLKDLNQPMKLYQILSPEIIPDFPPLKTLDARPNNLPIQLTSFIGREKEMTEIKSILENSKLLTLLASGGAGKTSLAMQVGADLIDDYMNGVFIIELASVSDSSLVLQSLMNSLGIKEVKDQSQDKTTVEYLKDREMLLIIDNCEHLINECAILIEMLLSNCPKLKIIATSREALNISGEKTYRVPSLSHPDPEVSNSLKALTRFEAVRLFIERALIINNNFRVTNENAPALAQICFQLDGIPLAIELAAARIKVLPLEGINERLTDRFKLLTGGKRTALPRQQTLKALIDWSYDLLSEKEKIMLQRLTIFSGGWTMESSEEICSDEFIGESEILDLLESLNSKSLIKAIESDFTIRYTMLETIKRYGDDLLILSGKKSELLEKYFKYFFKFTENSENKLTGAGQKEWIKKFNSEYGNLRESLNWSLNNEPGFSLKMSVELSRFWEIRSFFTEALEYLRKSLECSDSADIIWKAKGIFWTGTFFIYKGNYSEAKKFLNQCLAMFKDLNNKDGEARTLLAFGSIAVFEGDYQNIDLYSGKSLLLSEELNNKIYIASNLQNIGLGLMQKGDHDAARNKLNESLKVFRELNNPVQIAKIMGNIGVLEFLLRNYDAARLILEESLQLRYELNDRHGISIALSNLGSVALELKDFAEAERLIEESLVIIKELGDRRIYVTTINNLGFISFYRTDYQKAVNLFRESVLVSAELGDAYSIAKGIEGFANVFIEIKKFKEGCILSAKYISLLKTSNKNLIEGELIRFDEITNILKSNLSEADFNKYWSEGELMTVEEALEYADSISFDSI